MQKRIAVIVFATVVTGLMSATATAQCTTQEAQLTLNAYRTKSLPLDISQSQKTVLRNIASMLKKGQKEQAIAAWKGFCGKYARKSNKKKLPRIERWILNQAYLGKGSPLHRTMLSWERRLGTVGAGANKATIDLQNSLQKQQSLVQSLSAVAKALHDTSMAVIRKIG